MTEPLITIVVPNKDGLEHLREFVPAVSTQSFPRDAFELIVVDNGSRDGSVDYLRSEHPWTQIVACPTNEGFAVAANRGAQAASGRLIAFLNNDTKPPANWLERMHAAITDSEPNVACVASRIDNWDGTRLDFAGGGISFNGMGFQDGYGDPVESAPGDIDRVLFACAAAMIVDRDVFLNAGGFDERFFAYYEDVDLGWRLWLLGYEVAFCGDAPVLHRGGATGVRFDVNAKLGLLERNALYCVIKNYGDDAFATILPAALLLAVKRAGVRSGPRRQRLAFASEPTPVTTTQTGRLQAVVRQALGRLGISPSAQGPSRAVLPDEAVATIAAVEDLIDDLPHLLAARSDIQRRRRRSDRELFALFPPRFVPESNVTDYRTAYDTVVRTFKLHELLRGTAATSASYGRASRTSG